MMRVLQVAMALSGIVAWTCVTADDVDAETVIEGRQANLRDMGAAFKAITDELRKSQPVLPVIQQYARQIDDLAQQQRFWFPVGTGPESEVETAAKAEIWIRKQEFADAQRALSVAAKRFLEAAVVGDVAALKAPHRALGASCKGCHETFREEE